MKIQAIATILLGAATFVSASASDNKGDRSSVAWTQALATVDQLVKEKVEKGGVPSYSIAIVSRNHPTWFLSVGYADLANKIKATPHTVYEIGSVTKVFTGTMLMQMRDAGRASLDDPLTKHFPEFHMPSPFTGQAAPTLRQLASHSSGLPSLMPLNNPMQEPSGASIPEMMKSLERTAPVFPPLTHYRYSNLGVDLMGYALARTAGQPWPDYIEQNILKPLDMRESSAARARLPAAKITVGYVPSGANGAWAPGAPMIFSPLSEASGAILSSATDMAKFVAWEMNDNDNRVLSGISKREMRTPLWMFDDWSVGVGVTWFLERLDGEVMVEHTGGTGGFAAVAAFVPRQGVGIVVLTNSTDDAHRFAFKLLSTMLAVAKQEPPAPQAALPPGTEKLAGMYLPGKGMLPLPPMFVKVDKGELVIDSPQYGHVRLVPTAKPGEFTAVEEQSLDGENVSFEDGKMVVGHGAMVFVRAPQN
jgi:CubicO group peptidase (beta-lactamase class C family)